MDAPPPADESATTAITNHMICLAREGGAEHICFLLALRATKTHSLPKTFKYVYHKWSLTICDGCFDTLKSSKMRS